MRGVASLINVFAGKREQKKHRREFQLPKSFGRQRFIKRWDHLTAALVFMFAFAFAFAFVCVTLSILLLSFLNPLRF